MGLLEPVTDIHAHELGIVVEGIAETEQMAEEVTVLGTRQLLYVRLPEIQSTAGTAALVSNKVLLAPPAYRWTIHHTVAVDDPMELFEVHEVPIDPRGEIAYENEAIT